MEWPSAHGRDRNERRQRSISHLPLKTFFLCINLLMLSFFHDETAFACQTCIGTVRSVQDAF